MNRETTLLKKNMNRKLFDDDLADEMLIQEKACMMDESDMIFDKDLLSGRDLFDIEGGIDDDYICLDNIIAKQISCFFR